MTADRAACKHGRDLLAGADAAPTLAYEATGADTGAFMALANRMLGREVREVTLVRTGAISLPQT